MNPISLSAQALIAQARHRQAQSKARVQKMLLDDGITPRSLRKVQPMNDADLQAQYDEQSAYWDRLYEAGKIDIIA